MATTPKLFELMLQCLDIDTSRFVFADLGCGKGRVLLLAAKHPLIALIGVELISELAEIAEHNLSHHKFADLTCASMAVVCEDAGKYIFPDDNLVVFLFNPFKSEIMQRVLANICSTGATKERYILYHNPVLASSLLDDCPHFSLMQKRPKFSIYRICKGLTTAPPSLSSTQHD